MTRCSAENCTNNSRKGFKMNRFPLEQNRRQIWTKNTGRVDWVPGANAKLCGKHFADDMWLTSANGKPRLKPDAIPTIFHGQTCIINGSEAVVNPQQSVFQKESDLASTKAVAVPRVLYNKQEQQGETVQANKISIQYEEPVCRTALLQAGEIESTSEVLSEHSNNSQCKQCSDKEKKLVHLKKLHEISEKSRIKLKRDLKAAKEQIRRLQILQKYSHPPTYIFTGI